MGVSHIVTPAMIAASAQYLASLALELQKQWPHNRTIHLVCHGHSVPAGYFATPLVDTFNAYPHLLHRKLKARFPFAVLNVIVTAQGGETSEQGAERFETQVLGHRPDVLTLDYALNDRRIGLYSTERAHRAMIEAALAREVKILLLGPTADKRCLTNADDRRKLEAHSAGLRALADEYEIGFVDVLALFDARQKTGDLDELLSWANHPNAQGHELVASALFQWFPIPVGAN